MLKLWKYSTVIFVLQVVAGAATYALSGKAFLATALANFTILTVGLTLGFTASIVAIAALFGLATFFTGFATLGVAAVFAALVAAQDMRDQGARETPWKLWLTALPLGIGTLGGGLLLLQARAKRA